MFIRYKCSFRESDPPTEAKFVDMLSCWDWNKPLWLSPNPWAAAISLVVFYIQLHQSDMKKGNKINSEHWHEAQGKHFKIKFPLTNANGLVMNTPNVTEVKMTSTATPMSSVFVCACYKFPRATTKAERMILFLQYDIKYVTSRQTRWSRRKFKGFSQKRERGRECDQANKLKQRRQT